MYLGEESNEDMGYYDDPELAVVHRKVFGSPPKSPDDNVLNVRCTYVLVCCSMVCGRRSKTTSSVTSLICLIKFYFYDCTILCTIVFLQKLVQLKRNIALTQTLKKIVNQRVW